MRFTYVRLLKKTVTALAMFAMEPPRDSIPSFAVGYAVPKRYQKQGRAKEVLAAAIADMQAGLARNGHPVFYLQAIVGEDNQASRNIAEQLLSATPEKITEHLSGLAAYFYLRKVTP